MRTLTLITAAALLAAPALSSQTPSLGVGGSIGTMGIAVDGAININPRIDIRARLAVMPYEPEFTIDDIQFAVTLPSPQYGLFADLQLVGPLRVTGGLRMSTTDLAAVGTFTGTVVIGPTTYTGTDVGTLSGAIVTKDLAPYLGIGLGRVAGSGIGFFLDLGVAFHGEPVLTFSADGPLATMAGPVGDAFRADLAAEQASAQTDITDVKYYPVIAVGLRYGF